MADEELYDVDGQLPLMADPFEAAEVQRLADILEAMDADAAPNLDPREDPELSSMVRTAGMLHESLADATETDSFDSYHTRSRAYVLHSLEADAIARPQTPRDPRIALFGPRPPRGYASKARWGALGAVAAAAAAVSIVFFTSGPGGSGSGDVEIGPPQLTNLTQPGGELEQIQNALVRIRANTSKGQPADTSSLRTVTETTAAVAKVIEKKPDTVTREAVTTYLDTVKAAAEVLEAAEVLQAAEPEDDNQGALAAAQVATEDGQATAAAFLSAATSTPTPIASPRATPTAIPTATPSPTATPTETPEPSPTATPEPTETPEPTATAEPTVEPTLSPTPTPEATPAP